MTFSPCEKYLYSCGAEGTIYQWDLRMRRGVTKTNDEGNFSALRIVMSPDGQYLASGSKMGSVNLYRVD